MECIKRRKLYFLFLEKLGYFEFYGSKKSQKDGTGHQKAVKVCGTNNKLEEHFATI